MGLPVREEFNGPVLKYDGYPYDDYGLPATVFWFVDDVPRDYLYAKYLHPKDIKSLFVVYFPETQNMAMYSGGTSRVSHVPKVIVTVYTDPESRGMDDNDTRNIVKLPEIQMTKEFYKPVYDTDEKRRSQVPDFRKTIHWEPDLRFNEDGIATVKFYNGDRYTRIKCIMEGVSTEGIPVYSEYGYNVSLIRE